MVDATEQLDAVDRRNQRVAIESVESRTREYVLSHLETARRYRALASAVHRCLRTNVPQR